MQHDIIFGMSIRQFLQIRDLGVSELRSNSSSLVNFNSSLPLATCFTPSLKITASSVWCIHLTLCQRLPALYLRAKREHVPAPPFTGQCISLSCWGEWVHWSVGEDGWEVTQWWRGRQLVFSCPSMVCHRHLSVPSVLCYKGSNFFPACSGELQWSAPACVLVWIYFRGFVFMLFENGQGALKQNGLNVH